MRTLFAADVLTDKGNLKSAVASGIKNQGIAKLTEMGFVVMPNGRLALQVADTDKGDIITLNIDLTVGLNTSFEKKAPKAKATKTNEPVEVPNLFD